MPPVFVAESDAEENGSMDVRETCSPSEEVEGERFSL